MNQKILKVKFGDVIEVSLDSNPSTGYRWDADFDTDFLKLKEKYYIPLSSKLGGGGKEQFSFLSLKHGKTTITMQYKRSWEKKVIKKEKFVIEII
ncbi:MAG: protease inhibitor I42 family protein [Candidatus Lokiarchaeota archaeon]|nr:protease inhibitor I42 family protein [Candidatus Lokiarchaeota archaeon]